MKKPLTFICRLKINFILHIFLETLQYCKLIVLGFFGYFGHAWLYIANWSYQLVENLRIFRGKNSTSSAVLFWRSCKDMETSYFRYFRHAWLQTPKMIVSTCRRLQCLSASQKSHTCQERGAHLRISLWGLLMNLENIYLLKKLMNKKCKNFNIHNVVFFKKIKWKHLDKSLIYTRIPKYLMI